jgi:ubiquinone biosynthesis protein
MLGSAINLFRLAKAGLVLAWYGARFTPPDVTLPGPLDRLIPRRTTPAKGERLARAVRALGPSYIKLGQFLSTRPDVVGESLADALSSLRDRLPAFSDAEAKAQIEAALGQPWNEVYATFGPPMAAASIAQVHQATIADSNGTRTVAVKILRPGIEKRFARDLDSFYFAARTIERLSPKSRRLRPVAAIDTVAQGVMLELDLRLEAAAIAEMAENIARHGDTGFRVPAVDWSRTARRVMTVEWIDGIPLTDLDALTAAGLDRSQLGLTVLRSFLKHAIRDGFFHADMHQGNLFADPKDGAIVAVDFGIVGRIGPNERRFLAEILYGFITKNYRRIAEVHFEAGYVPPHHEIDSFAQALRSIGEPIQDRRADEISMARLLTQLFEVTEQFDMRMRPELLLLQKTMVVVEGVARQLDPKLNIWMAAEPVVREWMTRELGPVGKMKTALANLSAVGAALRHAPDLLERGSKLIDAAASGIDTEEGAVKVEARQASPLVIPLWIATAMLIAIAYKLWFG